jgi:formate dehydrogenase subunit gamma
MIEKYSRAVRILHWVHSGAFVILFLTGMIFYIPGLASLAVHGWIHTLHRIGAGVFVVIPIIYCIIHPKTALNGIKLAFTWNRDDIRWLEALPGYYFKGDDRRMPAQGFLNSGQKLWWLLVLAAGAAFVVTGPIMWFAKTSASTVLLNRAILIHDISFIVTGTMFLVHIYNGVFHPSFNEAWSAITGGKISEEYARKHHAKWYNESLKAKQKNQQ